MSYSVVLDGNGDLVLSNPIEDKDVLVKVNDGGTVRTAIQVHGDSGLVSMLRQSHIFANINSSTGDFTVANNTWTTILFDEEQKDVLGEYNPATGIFTATEAGVYQASVSVVWQATNTGKRYYLKLECSGTGQDPYIASLPNSNPGYTPLSLSHSFALAVGETVKARVYQDSGGNEVLEGTGDSYNSFSVTKVS